MNNCPITYSPCGENRYSEKGLRLLASGLKTLKDLEYTAEEQRIESVLESISSSIQEWNKLIDLSFLSSEMRTKYHDL